MTFAPRNTSVSRALGDTQDPPPIPISPKLLETLRRSFPPIKVSPGTSIEDVMYSAGRQSVIEFLQYHFDVQNKTTVAPT